MNTHNLNNKINNYSLLKKNKTERISYLDPQRLLKNTTECKNSKILVKSLSEEILYFMTRGVSIRKFLHLLKRASIIQWEYFFDMDIWNKNKIDYISLSILITTMMIANPEKFSRWLFYKKINTLELYLHKVLNIKILEEEEEKYNINEKYFTNDGVFYFNFKKKTNATNNNVLKVRNKAIKNLLLKLSNIDLIRYQNVLLETSTITSTEMEETLLTNKNIRLLERGFPSYEKSVNIYKSCNLKKIKKKQKKINKLNLPQYLPKKTKFNKILNKFYKNKNFKIINNYLKNEFYSVCNKSIIANKKEINNLYNLYKIISKINNHILLGIQILSKHKFDSISNSKKIGIIENYSINNILGIFISRILIIKRIIKNWHNKSWLKTQTINFTLWNKKSNTIVKILIFEKSIRKTTNKLEFKNIHDIKKIEEKLQLIFDLDKLFSKIKIDLAYFKKNKLNYKSLLLNIWISDSMYFYKNKNYLNTKNTIFKIFYKKLLVNQKKNKKYFLLWVCNKLKINISSLPKTLTQLSNNLFETI